MRKKYTQLLFGDRKNKKIGQAAKWAASIQ